MYKKRQKKYGYAVRFKLLKSTNKRIYGTTVISLKKAEDGIDVQTEREGTLKGNCADEN
jgi:hypothetical protein